MRQPVEVLDVNLPETSPSDKEFVAPATVAETIFAEVLAGILDIEQVSVDSDFFDDLGADSMVMARFCARVRKREDVPSVSMKDIYQHSTIRSLASSLVDAAPQRVESSPSISTEVATSASTLQYVLCGTLQFLFFLAYCYAGALGAARGFAWLSRGSGIIDVYLRAVAVGGALFLALCTLPILAKWTLIGRWKPREIPVWSLAYVRFWIVKTLLRANPLALLFVGTPIYVLYLRALGAKVGRGVAIFSQHVPVCTDLLTVGAGTVIRKDSFFLCYRAHAGRVQTGMVTLGRDVFVGEKTVLDINTSMGDRAQIGHSSALHSGVSVPNDERWHGSPAQRTESDYMRVAPAPCGDLRRASYCILAMLQMFFLYIPLAEGGLFLLLAAARSLDKLLGPSVTLFGPGTNAVASRELYIAAALLSLVLFLGATLVELVLVFAVPRVLNLFIKPEKVYPLYGFHYTIHQAIVRLTNAKFFLHLFGDSSYIVYYLRCLGYRLFPVEQTGSNFGTDVRHENPYLSSVGHGTMVADGLSIMNAEYSSTSFRVSRVSIGPRNFLGNDIAYPPGGKTGDNCLLATKVMVPLDGEIREGVGLLGSPSFEIPRSVERDSRFDYLRTGDELRRRLAAKNRYNLRSMALFLLVRWLDIFLVAVLGLLAVALFDRFALLVAPAFVTLSILFTTVYYVLVERGLAGFRMMKPKYCSIYDPDFWWQERYWKLPAMEFYSVFDGTPFKSLLWRMLGVRVGKRVFDDGCALTERSLAAIGDDCTLNQESVIQCHSQEDGTFKRDRTTIGAGCTLGVGAFVHYGVTMGEGSVLAADSFLMKGEEVPPRTQWGGNPAREIRSEDYQRA